MKKVKECRNRHLDPITGTGEYKVGAVKLEKVLEASYVQSASR